MSIAHIDISIANPRHTPISFTRFRCLPKAIDALRRTHVNVSVGPCYWWSSDILSGIQEMSRYLFAVSIDLFQHTRGIYRHP